MEVILLFLFALCLGGCSGVAGDRTLECFSGELPLFTLSPEFIMTVDTDDLTSVKLNGNIGFRFSVTVESGGRRYNLIGYDEVESPSEILANAGESRLIYDLGGRTVYLSFISPSRNFGCHPVNYMRCWADDGRLMKPFVEVGSLAGLSSGTLSSGKDDYIFYIGYENQTCVQLWGNIILPVWKQNADDCINDVVTSGDIWSPASGPAYLRIMKARLNLSKDYDGQLIYVTCHYINQMTVIAGLADTLAMNGERELLEGLMNPIVNYAESDLWNAPFCPPDVGAYPFVMHRATDDINYDEITAKALDIIHDIDSLAGDCNYYKKHKDLICKWENYIK